MREQGEASFALQESSRAPSSSSPSMYRKARAVICQRLVALLHTKEKRLYPPGCFLTRGGERGQRLRTAFTFVPARVRPYACPEALLIPLSDGH